MDKIVILGNGPSMKSFSFAKLDNIPTIGMNVAYRYWERINWYPTYYCCLDTVVIESHHKKIRELIPKVKKIFVRENFLNHHPDLKDNNNVLILEHLINNNLYFKTKSLKITTGCYAIRYAMFLGFKEIYLLGIDCKYVEIINESKIIGKNRLEVKMTPEFNPNYFFNDYQQKGDRYHVPNPGKNIANDKLHVQVFRILKNDINNNNINVKIFNCNKKSVLYEQNIFPYIDIDSILNNLNAIIIPILHTNNIKSIINRLNGLARFKLIENKYYDNIEIIFISENDLSDQYKKIINNYFKNLINIKFFQNKIRFVTIEIKYDKYHKKKYGFRSRQIQFLNHVVNKFNYKYVLYFHNQGKINSQYWLENLFNKISNNHPWFINLPYGYVLKMDPDFRKFYNNKFLDWLEKEIKRNKNISISNSIKKFYDGIDNFYKSRILFD